MVLTPKEGWLWAGHPVVLHFPRDGSIEWTEIRNHLVQGRISALNAGSEAGEDLRRRSALKRLRRGGESLLGDALCDTGEGISGTRIS
jgi:hypothetical protein